MKNRIRRFRVLSAVMAACMAIQPVLPAIAAASNAKNLEQTLAKSNVFSRADEHESTALAAVWAPYLETFAGETEAFTQHLVSEQAIIEAMQDQLVSWSESRASLKMTDDSLKLGKSLAGLSKLLGQALSKRQSVVQNLLEHVETINEGVSSLKQGRSVSPQVFVRIYEFDMNTRLLDSARALTDRLWNVIVLAQVNLATRLELGETEREAFISVNDPLVDLLARESGSLAKWENGRQALQTATALTKPSNSIDVDREAVLLKASLKLADQTAAGLRMKPDANSKAHFEMVKRFKSVIERRSEQLVEIAQKPVEGLPRESFLLAPASGRLAGEWAEYAARQERIGRDLVSGLANADKTFQATWRISKQCIASAQKLIGNIRREVVPASGAEAFDALKKGLAEAEKGLASSSEAIKELNATRLALLNQAQAGGKPVFSQPDLRNRTEAVAYEDLGQTYELAQALAVEVRAQVAAVLTLTEAARSVGAIASNDELKNQVTVYDKHLSGWDALAAKKQGALEQYRRLCIDATSRYGEQVAGFAGQLKRELDASPKGQYAKVLREMLQKLERGSETITAFSEPILEAVQGTAPRISVPSLSWIGTSTVGGALTRMIERGAYFQGTGIGHVKALLDGRGSKDFSNTLSITDLAIALDYPTRAFVARDGMALVIGLDGPGVVIRGIGNVEQYKLNVGAAQISVVPDFTLNGVAVGGWFDGVGQFFNDVGEAAGDALNAAGQAIGGVVQGAQEFGAQVVDNVANAADGLWKGACEVGGFLWESVGTMANDIINDPVKLVSFAIDAGILIGGGIAIVATGGAATPLVAPFMVRSAASIVKDYSKACVKTAAKREWISEELSDSYALAADVALIVVDAKGFVKNLANAPRAVTGVGSLARGVTPSWTAGLSSGFRTAASAGEMSWKTARYLQYGLTSFKSYKSILTVYGLGQGVSNLVTDDPSIPVLPPATPPSSSRGGKMGSFIEARPATGAAGVR